MKRNDINHLATQTQAELQNKLQIINLELSKAKLAKSAGKLANLRSVSVLKDDVARIKTFLRQIQIKTEHEAKIAKKAKVAVKVVKEAEAEVTEVVKKAAKAVKKA